MKTETMMILLLAKQSSKREASPKWLTSTKGTWATKSLMDKARPLFMETTSLTNTSFQTRS